MALTITTLGTTFLDESGGNQQNDLDIGDVPADVIAAMNAILPTGFELAEADEIAGPDVSGGINAADYDVIVTSDGTVSGLSLTDSSSQGLNTR